MSEVQPEAAPENDVPVPVEAAPEATPVLQQIPSSEAPAEAAPATEEAPKTIEEAASALLALVDEGHKIGDRVVDAARDELRAILGA